MIEPNTIYTHYKGDDYKILFVLKDSTNARDGNDVVVYQSLSKGMTHCRDLEEFIEVIQWPDGESRPRFALKESL
jgi:hypothetical protein